MGCFNFIWTILLIANSCLYATCIVNGTKVHDLKEFKYQVAFKIQSSFSDKNFVCGGGILNDYLILTAAHCFFEEHENQDHLLTKVDIRLHTLENIRWTFGVIRRKVEELFLVAHWKALSYDLAIVKVDESLNLESRPDKLQALILPQSENSEVPFDRFQNTLAVVAGYGANEVHYEYNNTVVVLRNVDSRLRKLEVKVLNYNEHPCSELRLVKKYLCTVPVFPIYSGFCVGDSGGPLVINKGTSTEETIGIMLNGHASCNDYEEGGEYLRITDPVVFKFIKDIMAGKDFYKKNAFVDLQTATFQRRDCV